MDKPARTLLSALLFVSVLAFLAGYFVALWSTKPDNSPSYEIRQEGYTLINPLLECEMAQGYQPGHEIIPFKKFLKEAIARMTGEGRAETIAIYVRDLKNGPWMGINEREHFSPASLLKVPLMMAYLKAAEDDPAILRRELVYTPGEDLAGRQFFKPSTPMEPGRSYSIDDLLRRMLAQSDNNAYRLLTAERGDRLIFETLRDLGLAYSENPSDEFMSVRDYTSLFRVLFNGSYLNHAMSEKALSYMLDSEFRDGLRGGLPADVRVVSKFGERRGIPEGGRVQLHEFGIVYYPNHPYLIGIVTKGKDFESLAAVIRELSATVYREWDQQHPQQP